ncbi:unnamed protein product [Pipistrellus nathusii]|uniref:Uncharacterized protein n=1 Tax=Pipistrellus nathusii TaxID=59473 RepID=A0ABN9ZB90_PIPNA
MSSSEEPVSHITKDQSRPEVRVATWGSGEPGLVSVTRRPPTPKQARVDRQLKIFNCIIEHGAYIKRTGPADLEPKEAESKGLEAQEAEAAPLVTPDVHLEEQNAELEACPPPDLLPPPAASPAVAVEPGPAPDKTEAPPLLDEEPGEQA